MQIVEANDLWVRVVELHLTRRATPLRFVLYPMLHIGDPAFFAEVQRRLVSADLVVLEGVGPGAAARGLTSGYRRLAGSAALGLALQQLDVAALPGEVVRPDLTGAEFEERWRTVPWVQRALMQGAARSMPLMHRVLGDEWLRDVLASSTLDDLPDPDEPDPEWLRDVDRVLVDERDVRLVAALTDLHDRRSSEPITVAVVYGAAHMRAVTAALTRRDGYHVRSGEWLTVTTFA